jgi:hypothetical protein
MDSGCASSQKRLPLAGVVTNKNATMLERPAQALNSPGGRAIEARFVVEFDI